MSGAQVFRDLWHSLAQPPDANHRVVMVPSGSREVRRGEVSVRMLYDDHAVRMSCTRHGFVRVVPLDAPAFGRELVAFLQSHEPCSTGSPAVVIDLSGATTRDGVD